MSAIMFPVQTFVSAAASELLSKLCTVFSFKNETRHALLTLQRTLQITATSDKSSGPTNLIKIAHGAPKLLQPKGAKPPLKSASNVEGKTRQHEKQLPMSKPIVEMHLNIAIPCTSTLSKGTRQFPNTSSVSLMTTQNPSAFLRTFEPQFGYTKKRYTTTTVFLAEETTIEKIKGKAREVVEHLQRATGQGSKSVGKGKDSLKDDKASKSKTAADQDAHKSGQPDQSSKSGKSGDLGKSAQPGQSGKPGGTSKQDQSTKNSGPEKIGESDKKDRSGPTDKKSAEPSHSGKADEPGKASKQGASSQHNTSGKSPEPGKSGESANATKKPDINKPKTSATSPQQGASKPTSPGADASSKDSKKSDAKESKKDANADPADKPNTGGPTPVSSTSTQKKDLGKPQMDASKDQKGANNPSKDDSKYVTKMPEANQAKKGTGSASTGELKAQKIGKPAISAEPNAETPSVSANKPNSQKPTTGQAGSPGKDAAQKQKDNQGAKTDGPKPTTGQAGSPGKDAAKKHDDKQGSKTDGPKPTTGQAGSPGKDAAKKPDEQPKQDTGKKADQPKEDSPIKSGQPKKDTLKKTDQSKESPKKQDAPMKEAGSPKKPKDTPKKPDEQKKDSPKAPKPTDKTSDKPKKDSQPGKPGAPEKSAASPPPGGSAADKPKKDAPPSKPPQGPSNPKESKDMNGKKQSDYPKQQDPPRTTFAKTETATGEPGTTINIDIHIPVKETGSSPFSTSKG